MALCHLTNQFNYIPSLDMSSFLTIKLDLATQKEEQTCHHFIEDYK